MPLVQGASREAVSTNISHELDAGKPRPQAIAIALETARRNRADGGALQSPPWFVRNEARSMMHSGPISSIVPGRTDNLSMKVKPGAYVVNADTVSHLGQNNTQAGMAVLSHMFGQNGPYGGKSMGIKRGPGAPRPPRAAKFAEGGEVDGDDGVEIRAAGGEFVIDPSVVEAIGGGDIKVGHEVLDRWMKAMRKDHIRQLKRLPGPAKD